MARTREEERGIGIREGDGSRKRPRIEYEVKSETGKDMGVKILALYYGDLWRSALDRLNYRFDGHMFFLWHEGKKYSVYRRVDTETTHTPLRLKLVSNTKSE
jgi:hypothetical protein